MAWVVDTSVIVDIYLADPLFSVASARCLSEHQHEGMVICPISYIELYPACRGKESVLQEFLAQLGVQWQEVWTWVDTQKAGLLWNRYAQRKGIGVQTKRPLADVLIGAFSYRFQGLITRNQDDFRRLCPGLVLVTP